MPMRSHTNMKNVAFGALGIGTNHKAGSGVCGWVGRADGGAGAAISMQAR